MVESNQFRNAKTLNKSGGLLTKSINSSFKKIKLFQQIKEENKFTQTKEMLHNV